MSQSLAKNLVHLIYSTKNRAPCLSTEVRPNLYAYMSGILANWESPALVIGGVADHVHLLFSLSKNHALKLIVQQVKQDSSKWIKEHDPMLSGFHWQAGYGAFSVSASNVPDVRQYIVDQEAHHARRTFQDEFREFLKRHEVEFDERYVWD